tara:strand:- start:2764 stop:4572 length:1809 start_codon:yes stop_codon:yes gene_type:complete
MILSHSKKRIFTLLIILISGIFIFLIGLGSTGLVDETPPLFASAGRLMSESGDWLTPKVNGILRFDKPPLFYWMMAIFYSIPGNSNWDNLGSLSARLPSALSSLFLMIMLADTLYCWPQRSNNRIYIAFVASLAFALSPLVLVWSRTAVSDSLLCGTIGISLLSFWRRLVSDTKSICITPWIFLGLAILTKGPVALIIVFLTLCSFFATQINWKKLIIKINPIKGILITSLVSLPWYIIELYKEGVAFWDSFFGYHNLQRYTSVVNNHSEPWWFFIYILLLGSLPFSVFLISGIFENVKELITNFKRESKLEETLGIFAFCWLISIFLFFSISATKLPSYWLPATPAAAILIASSANSITKNLEKISLPILGTVFILFGFSIASFLSNKWLGLINDPELPNLASEIEEYGLILKTRFIFLLMAIVALLFLFKRFSKAILYLQIFFLSGQFLIMPPARKLTDISRQLPLRNISKEIQNIRQMDEPLAMIGIRKPSLHFYSKQIVFYEPNSPQGIMNLSERFLMDKRSNYYDQPNYEAETFLVVIDIYSEDSKYWKKYIRYQNLANFGIYKLLRVKRKDLDRYANYFKRIGKNPDWEINTFEKF